MADTIPRIANPVAPKSAEAMPAFLSLTLHGKVLDAVKVMPIIESRAKINNS